MSPGQMTPRRFAVQHAKTPSKKEANKNDQGEEGIQVAVRLRPLNKTEGVRRRIWKVLAKYNAVTQTTPEGTPVPNPVVNRTFFEFDKTFGEGTSTQQVYDNVAKNIVSSVTSGLNGTIFAYGQTSSGKTFTMQGSGTVEQGSAGTGGIVHMAAKDIFDHIESKTNRMFIVRASFLEIYNEEVRDLLTNGDRTVEIREDPRKGVFVQAAEEYVTDVNSLLGVLFKGEKARSFAATAMNERSSRGHTIFRITIESKEKIPDEKENEASLNSNEGVALVSTLNLVDLAGSESVRHTGAKGDRQKEGGMINKSLLALSQVIVALGNSNNTHINFRDSKLTRLLQPSLSGNARISMICCATPSELYLEETRSTLQFASRAKLVKTRAQINKVMDDRSIIRRLQRELAELRRHTGGTVEENNATAGAIAREDDSKVRCLQAKILNNWVAFADKTGPNQHKVSKPLRKRRLSDGNIPLCRTPLAHAALRLQTNAKTTPRPEKKTKLEVTECISPSVEIGFFRQALQVKRENILSIKSKKDATDRLVEKKDVAMKELENAKSVLESSHGNIKEEMTKLETEATLMQEDLAAIQKDRDEKESKIQKLIANLEQEKADRGELETAIDELQSSCIDASKERDELRSELDEKSTALASAATEINSLKESISNHEIKHGEASAGLETLLEEKKSALKQIEAMEGSLETSTRRIEEVESQASGLTGQLREAEEKLAKFEESLEEESKGKAVWSDKCKAFQLELQTSIDKIALLETANAEVLKERDAVCSKLDEKSGFLSSAETKIKELEENMNSYKIKQEKISAELGAVLEETEETVKKHEETQVQHSNEKSTWEAESRALKEELQATVKTISELEHSVSVLETSRVDVSKERDELRSELDEKSTALASAATEINSLKESISNHEIKHGEASAGLETLLEEKKSALKQIEAMEGSLETSTRRIEEVESQASGLTGQLREAEEKVVKLEGNLEDVSKKKLEIETKKQAFQQGFKTALEKIAVLEAAKAETSRECDDIRSELSKKSESLLSAETRVNELKESLKEAAENIVKLEESFKEDLKGKAAWSDKCDVLQQELQKSIDKNAILETAKAEVLKERDAVCSKLDEKSGFLSSAKTKIIELEKSLSQYKADEGEASKEYAELQTEIEMLRKTNANLKDCNSKLDVRVEELEVELNALNSAQEETEREVLDLKTLLASNNRSTEQSRAAALAVEDELERKEKELEEALHLLSERDEELRSRNTKGLDAGSSIGTNQELVKAIEEKEEIKKLLKEEKLDRRRMEESLKIQMRDEQSALKELAERTMKNYRKQIFEQKELLERSEAEAYATRETNESLRDECKRTQEEVVSIRSKISAIQSENEKYKGLEKEGGVKILGLEHKNRTQDEEIQKLKLQLADKESIGEVEVVSKLKIQVAELSDQLRSKEDRMKYLESVQLTREKKNKIKKLKTEHGEYKHKLKIKEKEVENLKAMLSRKSSESQVSASDTVKDTDITQLIFEKELLEKKLRKYATHCQDLEQEKAEIVNAVRSNLHDDFGDDSDLSKMVYTLCDKVVTLESSGSHKKDNEEILKLRDRLSSLQSEISDAQHGKFELQRIAESTKNEMSNLEREKRYLQRENLQIMDELKRSKQERRRLQTELQMLSIRSSEEATLNFGENSALPDVTNTAIGTKQGFVHASTPSAEEKENNGSTTNKLSTHSKPRQKLSSRKRNTPGLGEASNNNDENTQECTQS